MSTSECNHCICWHGEVKDNGDFWADVCCYCFAPPPDEPTPDHLEDYGTRVEGGARMKPGQRQVGHLLLYGLMFVFLGMMAKFWWQTDEVVAVIVVSLGVLMVAMSIAVQGIVNAIQNQDL